MPKHKTTKKGQLIFKPIFCTCYYTYRTMIFITLFVKGERCYVRSIYLIFNQLHSDAKAPICIGDDTPPL